MSVIVIMAILFIFELVYFKIAEKYNITDKPSARGSSTFITIRGGGIIFPIAILLMGSITGFTQPFFMLGLLLVSCVSFIDDIHSLSPKVRLPLYLIGILLLIIQFHEIFIPEEAFPEQGRGMYFDIGLMIVIALIVCTGAMNIFNFMDGINGITGGYSLVVLLSIYYVLRNHTDGYLGHDAIRIPYGTTITIIYAIIADFVFLFFNFRKKAKCFAGDVGAVSIAFFILFGIGTICVATWNFSWFAFLVVYGTDGVLTIFHRVMLGENITQPHRKHMYQIMANELHIPHIWVSAIYMAMQAACCIWFIIVPGYGTLALQVIMLSAVYIIFMKKYYHLHEESIGTKTEINTRP